MSFAESGFFRRLISGIFGSKEPSEEPESFKLIFEESLFTSDRAEYLEFLDAYVQCISNELVPPPGSLQEKLAEYLRQLTQEIVPPSPELVEEFFDYVGSRVEPQANFPPYEQVVAQLREEFFPVLTPADFEPLDAKGVEQSIVLFNMGATYSALTVFIELFKMLKTIQDKAKQFEVPSGFDVGKHVFQKGGPFQLMVIGKTRFHKSVPLKDINKSATKSVAMVTWTRTDQVPDKYGPIIAVTAELAKFAIMLTDKPIPQSGLAPVGTTWFLIPKVGSIVVIIDAEYNLLKSYNTVNLTAWVANHFGYGRDQDYLTVLVDVELKYYALDFRK